MANEFSGKIVVVAGGSSHTRDHFPGIALSASTLRRR
jgi:hypothetical protein